MSRLIQSQIAIAASPERVWSVLTDFVSYPGWNPFIRSISGDVRVRGRLRIRIAPPGGGEMTFGPVVTEVRQASVLEWVGHAVVPGVFDGRHRFTLTRLPDGTTSFSQGEEFSGFLVPFFGSLLRRTQSGFEAANAALKGVCEAV